MDSSQPSSVADPKPAAEQLKLEGNKLQLSGQYEAANEAYSRAIELDPENALLYANRSQSNLKLKKYLDASLDARKALEINPSFVKAWARLGTAQNAMMQYQASIEAWQNALGSLPPDEVMYPSEKSLKQQCEAGLKFALEEQAAKQHARNWQSFPDEAIDGKKLPWDKALAIKDRLLADKDKGMSSSAWVIMGAYREWSEAIRVINSTKRIETSNEPMWEGETTALTQLSNALLREPRVFHLSDREFLKKYDEQVIFETTKFDAWAEGGADVVRREAPRRLEERGWGNLRDALNTTIRAWVIAGFLASGGYNTSRAALEFYSQALDILQWGRTVWPEVPREERGSVFDVTFIRGVRRLFLSALVEACVDNPGPNSEYDVNDLYVMARDHMGEIQANPIQNADGLDPGFVSSFWVYPLAEAHSILGFVHFRKAMENVNKPEVAAPDFRKASEWYIEAAGRYPVDDEKHIHFLVTAIQSLWHCGTKLEEFMPLAKRVRLAVPQAKEIWEFSQLSDQLNLAVKRVLDFEEKYQKGLDAGLVTMQDVIRVTKAPGQTVS